MHWNSLLSFLKPSRAAESAVMCAIFSIMIKNYISNIKEVILNAQGLVNKPFKPVTSVTSNDETYLEQPAAVRLWSSGHSPSGWTAR